MGHPVRCMIAVLSLSIFLVLPTKAAPMDLVCVAPNSGPWDAGGGFKFDKKEKKTRQALSGIACPANSSGKRLCLVVFDEGREARYVVVEHNAYAIDDERVELRPGDAELDAEAATTDDEYYYVTGSHSVERKTCDNNPDSRYVIRFRVDRGTGRALRERGQLVDYKSTGDLWTIMSKVPGLKDHVGDNRCLGTESPEESPHLAGKRGVNIEGLAIKDGRLFFGFRGPAADATAKVLTVNVAGLFDGGDPNPRLSTITVERGRAIRDLHPVRGGILVLIGPDDDKANANVGWIIARWDGQDAGDAVSQPMPLARLDFSSVQKRACDKELKPEALAVVDDTPGEPYRVVILSDGMCDGGPLSFTVPR